MTKPRAIVSASLAERGRPEQWANEQESAALSGMSAEFFAAKLDDLEAIGFPKPSPWNGKRFIPAIIEFWREHHARPILPSGQHADDERNKETFDEAPNRGHTRKRVSA